MSCEVFPWRNESSGAGKARYVVPVFVLRGNSLPILALNNEDVPSGIIDKYRIYTLVMSSSAEPRGCLLFILCDECSKKPQQE